MASGEEETVSKINQITARSETIEVGADNTEFEIKAFENNEFLNLVVGNRNKDMAREDVIVKMVTKILQKDDPNITEEQVREAPDELKIKTIEAMEGVNGLEDFFEKAERQMQNQQL